MNNTPKLDELVNIIQRIELRYNTLNSMFVNGDTMTENQKAQHKELIELISILEEVNNKLRLTDESL